MPTARSSTEADRGARPAGTPAGTPTRTPTRTLAGTVVEARRSLSDVRALYAFRVDSLRGRARRAVPVVLAVLAAVTVACSALPALGPGLAVGRPEVARLLSSELVSVLVVSIASVAASGGGRELLPRDQGVAFPVSPTSDHLGALVMAPLNVAWLLQAWFVLASTSYVAGPRPGLLLALLVVPAWLLVTSTVAQALAWAVEWVRRGPAGRLVVRLGAATLAAGAAVLVATGRIDEVLAHSPTRPVARAVSAGAEADGPSLLRWAVTMLVLLALASAALVLGAWLAARVAARPAREELRVETATHPPRPHPASDLAAMARTDRTAIWRSVPMRRGMVVLALLPGLVALGGSFTWGSLGVFPGLVASGGALLFGVNAWCLDGRGALWRESLPVSPWLAFGSRALVLVEILLASSLLTLAVASLRAGVPTAAELVAVLCSALVVCVQVVATAMRWSVRHPYAVDLRSARATPAPPLAMVGYSARLALTSTCTGLVFEVLGRFSVAWSLLACVPFLAWSIGKLVRTAGAWNDPPTRSAVVGTVAS